MFLQMSITSQFSTMNLITTTLGDKMNTFFLPILVVSLISWIIFKLINSSQTLPLPPGPYAWPIVGNIFQMRGKNRHHILANLAKVHGPLFCLRLGTQLLVVGSSPAAAAEILKTHDRILSGRSIGGPIRIKGSKFHNLQAVLSDECGDGWKNLRNIYKTQLFSTKAIESQVIVREKKVMEMISYLGSKEGVLVKIKDMVYATFLNMTSNILFSMDFVDMEGEGVGKEIRRCIRATGEVAGTPQLSELYPRLFIWFDYQNKYNKFIDLHDKMCNSWAGIIKERRQGKIRHSSTGDFTDALIGMGFTDEQINQMIQEIFNGSTESTSATCEWALVELMRNREVMSKLRNELGKVISGDTVKESDLPYLPYLEACFKETLRLHPPGPLLLPHRAVQNCQVMGYTIPKDSAIMVNIWTIARDPTIWDDPMSFKPERFLEPGCVDYKGQDFEFIPFSSGRRICPGLPLVSKTVPLIVASLIHTYDWILPNNMDPAQIDMKDSLDINMQKEEPLLVIPKFRTSSKNVASPFTNISLEASLGRLPLVVFCFGP